MAHFEITIPDADLPRVEEAFATAYNWQEEDGPKTEFVRSKIVNFVRATVESAEVNAARDAVAVTPFDSIS